MTIQSFKEFVDEQLHEKQKSGGEEEYEKFFRATLKKFGVDEPDELEGDKKKEFYDYIDRNWKADDEKANESVNEARLPSRMVKDYEKRAEAERRAGGEVEINNMLPTVAVTLSDGSDYFFQEHEASDLLDQVPSNIAPEDFILAMAQSW